MSRQLRPSKIRYSRNSISSKFGDGTLTLVDTFEELLTGEITVDDIEHIEVVKWNGNWRTYTGDRRLFLFKKLEELGIVSHISVVEVSLDQWRSDDFRAPPQTTCLGPWPRVYGDYFFLAGPWRAPSTPRAPPRSRGLRGPRYATALDSPEVNNRFLLRVTTECHGKSIICRQPGAVLEIDKIIRKWKKKRLYPIPPSKIWFTHNLIDKEFDDDRRLSKTFSKLLQGDIDVDVVPSIEVFHWKGKWKVLDGNRRLYIYQKLEEIGELSEIQAVVGSAEDPRVSDLDGDEETKEPKADCEKGIMKIIKEWNGYKFY